MKNTMMDEFITTISFFSPLFRNITCFMKFQIKSFSLVRRLPQLGNLPNGTQKRLMKNECESRSDFHENGHEELVSFYFANCLQ